MGTDLIVAGRSQLASYAGFAGVIRGRARPFAVIAAVDVLAVVLAFGAIQLTGMMVSGNKLPQLIPPVSAATEPVAAITPLVPPAPRLAPARHVLAAMPDAAVMFGTPVALAAISRGFTFDSPTNSGSSSFVPPTTVAAAEPEPIPGPGPIVVTPDPTPVPTPHMRPLQRVAKLTTPVIDAADGSLDRLVLRDVVPAVGTTVAQTGSALRQTVTDAASVVSNVAASTGGIAAPVQAVVQPVQTVAQNIASPVETVAQNVTQPVTQVVKGVASLLR